MAAKLTVAQLALLTEANRRPYLMKGSIQKYHSISALNALVRKGFIKDMGYDPATYSLNEGKYVITDAGQAALEAQNA